MKTVTFNTPIAASNNWLSVQSALVLCKLLWAGLDSLTQYQKMASSLSQAVAELIKNGVVHNATAKHSATVRRWKRIWLAQDRNLCFKAALVFQLS